MGLTDYMTGMEYKRHQSRSPVLEAVVKFGIRINDDVEKNPKSVANYFMKYLHTCDRGNPARLSEEDLVKLYFSVLEDLPAFAEPQRHHVTREERRPLNPERFWSAMAAHYSVALEYMAQELWQKWGSIVQVIHNKQNEVKETRLVVYRA